MHHVHVFALFAACVTGEFGDELDRAELRHAGPAFTPPQNLLEVEAVIRGLHGEAHLLDEVAPKRLRETLAFVLRYLTDSEPEIHGDFDTVVDEARQLMRQTLIGSSEP